MEQGVYLAARSISEAWWTNAHHQFILLVPDQGTPLAQAGVEVNGVRIIFLAAYNVAGFLRARRNQRSDVEPFARGDAEVDRVRHGIEYASPDQPIRQVLQHFQNYQTHEGTARELTYPSNSQQFEVLRYNSNSWAQSCIFWAFFADTSVRFRNDFGGFDLGRTRTIPRPYFQRA